jgi:hypothetical protein
LDPSVVLDHAKLAEELPLDQIDLSDPALYQQDLWRPYFRRLRRDAPVHYCRESPIGPFWSVTKHRDIIDVEVRHGTFSSSSALSRAPAEESPPSNAKAAAGTKNQFWRNKGSRNVGSWREPEAREPSVAAAMPARADSFEESADRAR